MDKLIIPELILQHFNTLIIANAVPVIRVVLAIDFFQPDESDFKFDVVFFVEEIFLSLVFGQVLSSSFWEMELMDYLFQHCRAEEIELFDYLIALAFGIFGQVPVSPAQAHRQIFRFVLRIFLWLVLDFYFEFL